MVTAAQTPPTPLTPQEYFDWEEQQELRYEYFDGEVFAMTGRTVPHGLIGVNLVTALKSQLRGRGCLVLNSDCKVGITESGPFTYPDVSVTCDLRDRSAQKFALHPCLIVEVLSPNTEAYDRGGKFAIYRRLESLQEYVLVSSETQSVEVFRRQENGIWRYQPYADDGIVELLSIGLNLPVGLIYEDVVLPISEPEE
jgi:Uma2 family endonuclease